MKKSTHRGTCQACGAAQKLPSGNLAKHGYTVSRWGGSGFFNGTCQGSGAPPYEASCDLISLFVTTARQQQADMKAFSAKLRERPTDLSKAWIHLWRTNRYTRGHHWMEVPITFKTVTVGSSSWLTATYEHPDDLRQHRIDVYGERLLEPVDWIVYLNEKRAKDVEQEIVRIQTYIDWQESRIAAWKESPLLPLEK